MTLGLGGFGCLGGDGLFWSDANLVCFTCSVRTGYFIKPTIPKPVRDLRIKEVQKHFLNIFLRSTGQDKSTLRGIASKVTTTA